MTEAPKPPLAPLAAAAGVIDARDTNGWSAKTDTAIDALRSAVSAKPEWLPALMPLDGYLPTDGPRWTTVNFAACVTRYARDYARQAVNEAEERWRAEAAKASHEGCTPADARMPRAANQHLAAENDRLRLALQFYAERSHFVRHQPDAWDTVSGEPANYYEDESNTATVEDGSVAKAALVRVVIPCTVAMLNAGAPKPEAPALPQAARDVLAERQRQIEVEGYSRQSDAMSSARHNVFRTPHPTCPHCGHEMDTDEMLYGKPTCEDDLFALAPNEGNAAIECPRCDKQYWVHGGYQPHYTSAFSEEELQ